MWDTLTWLLSLYELLSFMAWFHFLLPSDFFVSHWPFHLQSCFLAFGIDSVLKGGVGANTYHLACAACFWGCTTEPMTWSFRGWNAQSSDSSSLTRITLSFVLIIELENKQFLMQFSLLNQCHGKYKYYFSLQIYKTILIGTTSSLRS